MAYSKPPESIVKKQGREICKKLGIYYFPVNQTGMSKGGIPDDVLCVNGRFVHIEYKAHMDWTKKTKTAFRTLPTNLQVKRMEEARVSNAITLVVDDSNIQYLEIDLETILEGANKIIMCNWQWSLKGFLNYKGEVDASST